MRWPAAQIRLLCSPSAEDGKTRPSMLRHLTSKIKATGPITVAEYMREVLTNPVAVSDDQSICHRLQVLHLFLFLHTLLLFYNNKEREKTYLFSVVITFDHWGRQRQPPLLVSVHGASQFRVTSLLSRLFWYLTAFYCKALCNFYFEKRSLRITIATSAYALVTALATITVRTHSDHVASWPKYRLNYWLLFLICCQSVKRFKI